MTPLDELFALRGWITCIRGVSFTQRFWDCQRHAYMDVDAESVAAQRDNLADGLARELGKTREAVLKLVRDRECPRAFSPSDEGELIGSVETLRQIRDDMNGQMFAMLEADDAPDFRAGMAASLRLQVIMLEGAFPEIGTTIVADEPAANDGPSESANDNSSEPV